MAQSAGSSDYSTTWHAYLEDSPNVYSQIRDSYNNKPNPFDLLFLCRSCYGGVVRFTREGKMSTPIGPHRPISPDSLAKRMAAWRKRVQDTEFIHAGFEETMGKAEAGDVVYCDPPYVHSQAILYGSQSFSLPGLFESIEKCVSRGAKALLSIDGCKKSGKVQLDLDRPEGLFRREVMVNCGRSMLRRFQKKGTTMAGETVHDRLLLTW